MPVILIIVGIIVALGFGGFLFMQDTANPAATVETPVARVEDTATVTPSTPETSASTTTTVTSTTTDTPTKPAPTPTPTPTPTPAPTPKPVPPVVVPKTAYKNGTYTVTTSYVAPGRTTHSVTTTLKLANDVVTEANVSYGGDSEETSSQYQRKFSQSYQAQVVGKKLDAISLSRVGGASLTTGAYNKALAEVKTSAKS